MIEELKELVALVNSLPQLALWVAIGFWAYKVIIVGSIYGVIRMVVQKAHDWATKPRPTRQDVNVVINDVVYYHDKDALIAALKRIMPNNQFVGSQGPIDWLNEAISEKMEKDGPPKK